MKPESPLPYPVPEAAPPPRAPTAFGDELPVETSLLDAAKRLRDAANKIGVHEHEPYYEVFMGTAEALGAIAETVGQFSRQVDRAKTEIAETVPKLMAERSEAALSEIGQRLSAEVQVSLSAYVSRRIRRFDLMTAATLALFAVAIAVSAGLGGLMWGRNLGAMCVPGTSVIQNGHSYCTVQN